LAARQAKASGRPSIGQNLDRTGYWAIAAFSLVFAPTAALSAILASAGIALFRKPASKSGVWMYSFRNPEAADQLRFPQAAKAG